jgi:hypothetical protein
MLGRMSLAALLIALLPLSTQAAGEVQIVGIPTGQTLYYVLFSGPGEADAGEAWDGDSWEPYTTTRATWDIAMAEVSTTGQFLGTLPAIGKKNIVWAIYQDANDDAMPSHTDDILLYEGRGEWSGSYFGTRIIDGTGQGEIDTASGIAQANMKQVDDDATAAVNAESFFDGNGYGPLVWRSTVATVNSQTDLELTAAPAIATAWLGCRVLIRDVSSAGAAFTGVVTGTNTGGVQFDPDGTAPFTIATGDIVEILPPAFGKEDRELIDAEVAAIQAKTNLIVAAPANWSALSINGSGHIGRVTLTDSVSGAVGSVIGSVGSIAVGGISDLSFEAGAIDANAIDSEAITASEIASDAIGGAEWAAGATTEVQTGLATATALDAVDNFVDTEVADIKAKTDLIPTFPTNFSALSITPAGLVDPDMTGFTVVMEDPTLTAIGERSRDVTMAAVLANFTVAGTAGEYFNWSKNAMSSSGVFKGSALAAGPAASGTSQPRVNFFPDPGFTRKVPRGVNGVHRVAQAIPLPPGAVGNVAVALDMSDLFGFANFVKDVGTPVAPTVSGGLITAAGLGPRDWFAMVNLTGTAAAGETQTVTVPVKMTSGTSINVVFTIKVGTF